jgi:cold shock CspA family protein
VPQKPDPLAQAAQALQAELTRRSRKKLDALLQALREGDTDSLYAVCRAIEHVVARLPDIPEPTDPDEPSPLQQIEEIAAVAHRLLLREKVLADEASGAVHRPRPTMRVRSAHQVVAPKPKLDPAAPRQERIGRRREPVSSGAPPEDGMTRRGVVLSFDQRSMGGVILVAGGKEIAIAEGAASRAGLTNLFPQQRVEFRIEADHNGRKAESIKLI